MANIRELKVRIKSVGNIRQITRAMEMVATTKLRRFQDRAVASGPYSEEIEKLVQSLAASVLSGDEVPPLFQERKGLVTGILLVTSDRGLCGAYNANIFSLLRRVLREQEGRDLRFYVIGKKGSSFVKKLGLHLEAYLDDPSLELIGYRDAARISRFLTEEFTSGKVDEMRVVYTKFLSMAKYQPTDFRLLPLSAEKTVSREEGGFQSQPLLVPSEQTIFERLVPKYLETRLFNLLMESLTSEYASRMVSMKSATDAAGEMQADLRKEFNRARQERITTELLDIVGGAEAIS